MQKSSPTAIHQVWESETEEVIGTFTAPVTGAPVIVRPLDQGVDWFGSLDGAEQFEVPCGLAGFCIQARALIEDRPEAIRKAGIRPTRTPVVLIIWGHLTEQLTKIINLPQDERVKAFRLLVALLGVADERRRARFCAHGCSHAAGTGGPAARWCSCRRAPLPPASANLGSCLRESLVVFGPGRSQRSGHEGGAWCAQARGRSNSVVMLVGAPSCGLVT